MFDHLFRTLFKIIDRSMEDVMREMEREIARLREEMEKEIERLEHEGNRNVREIELPGGGWIRVETFRFELPFDTGGRIRELPLDKKEESEPRERTRSGMFEEVVDVGGIPLKLEKRDRSWREENR
ncbi:hypothetical protein [Methanopyrus sp.]